MVLNLKNAAVFRFLQECDYLKDVQKLEEALIENCFTECAPQQEASEGFSPIGPLVYEDGHPIYLLSINDRFHLFCYTREVKTIPGDFFRARLQQKVDRYKEKHGRFPAKGEKEDLAMDLKAELLPHAFPRIAHTFGYFDTQKKLLVLCTNSAKVMDEVASLLRGALQTLPVAPFDYSIDPSTLFTEWAVNGTTNSDTLHVLSDFEMRLKTDDATSIVNCKQVEAGTDEVTCHTDTGKKVSKIALAYQDAMRFTVSDDVIFRSIKITLDDEDEYEDADSLIMAKVFLFCRTVDDALTELHKYLPVKEAA